MRIFRHSTMHCSVLVVFNMSFFFQMERGAPPRAKRRSKNSEKQTERNETYTSKQTDCRTDSQNSQTAQTDKQHNTARTNRQAHPLVTRIKDKTKIGFSSSRHSKDVVLTENAHFPPDTARMFCIQIPIFPQGWQGCFSDGKLFRVPPYPDLLRGNLHGQKPLPRPSILRVFR